MDTQEIEKYKEMSFGEINEENIPRPEDMEDGTGISSSPLYIAKVGEIIVKCSYAKNGKTLEDCLISYLKKKALLMDG